MGITPAQRIAAPADATVPGGLGHLCGLLCCCRGSGDGYAYRPIRSNVVDWRAHPLAQEYVLIRVVGEGGFSEVWLAQHKVTKESAAFKVVYLKRPGLRKDQAATLHQEAKLLRLMDHPGIVRCRAVLETRYDLVLVLEHLTGGELLSHLHLVHHYSEATAAGLLQQVIDAVAYLHSLDIVHRDIKPENLLLARPVAWYQKRGMPLRVKLIDLGMAAVLVQGRPPCRGCLGSPGFIAPEVVCGGPHTPAMDVYALGALLFVMLTGRKPWALREVRSLHYAMAPLREAPGLQDPLFLSCSEPARALVLSMMHDDPAQRPTARQVLAHPWVCNLAGPAAGRAARPPQALNPLVRTRMIQLANLRRYKGLAFALMLSADAATSPAARLDGCKQGAEDETARLIGEQATSSGADTTAAPPLGRKSGPPQEALLHIIQAQRAILHQKMKSRARLRRMTEQASGGAASFTPAHTPPLTPLALVRQVSRALSNRLSGSSRASTTPGGAGTVQLSDVNGGGSVMLPPGASRHSFRARLSVTPPPSQAPQTPLLQEAGPGLRPRASHGALAKSSGLGISPPGRAAERLSGRGALQLDLALVATALQGASQLARSWTAPEGGLTPNALSNAVGGCALRDASGPCTQVRAVSLEPLALEFLRGADQLRHLLGDAAADAVLGFVAPERQCMSDAGRMSFTNYMELGASMDLEQQPYLRAVLEHTASLAALSNWPASTPAVLPRTRPSVLLPVDEGCTSQQISEAELPGPSMVPTVRVSLPGSQLMSAGPTLGSAFAAMCNEPFRSPSSHMVPEVEGVTGYVQVISVGGGAPAPQATAAAVELQLFVELDQPPVLTLAPGVPAALAAQHTGRMSASAFEALGCVLMHGGATQEDLPDRGAAGNALESN